MYICVFFSFTSTYSTSFLRKTRVYRVAHGPEELHMARMLTIAHAARYACQSVRNQAQPWWGMINKFEAATSYWQSEHSATYYESLNFNEAIKADQDAGTRMRQMQG